MAAISTNFTDLLDPRFQKIFNEQYKQLPDRVSDFYDVMPGTSFPTKDTARFSQVGTFGDLSEWNGTVQYDDVFQGYDATLTHKEYSSGFQIERKLFSDEIMDILHDLNKNDGTTIVMVTHDDRFARRTDRIVRLFDGRQVA